MIKNSRIVVGLLWHSVNSANLGVGALTVAHIAILERIAEEMDLDVQFKILGWQDPEPAYVKGGNIEVVPLRARSLVSTKGLYAAARSCDVVLDISAGDSFADIYGTQRFLYNLLAKLAVVCARRPLILSPQTIGPFERGWSRLMAATLMRLASKVVTRDALSSAYLKELGLEKKLLEATDVAILLPYNKPEHNDSEVTRVGLNVSGLLFNGGYSEDNMFSLQANYPELIRSICAYFAALPDCELHLVGHVNSSRLAVEDDYRVNEQLAAEFPGLVVAPRFEDPSAAKSYIAALDFFAGARMHACIAAFSSGVPVLPIAYSRKFSGMFGTLGYTHLADCKSQSDEEILNLVKVSFANRAQLKAEVEQAFTTAQKKIRVYENLVRDAFAEVG